MPTGMPMISATTSDAAAKVRLAGILSTIAGRTCSCVRTERPINTGISCASLLIRYASIDGIQSGLKTVLQSEIWNLQFGAQRRLLIQPNLSRRRVQMGIAAFRHDNSLHLFVGAVEINLVIVRHRG